MTNRMRYREILWDSRWFKFDNILSFYFQILQYNLYRYNQVQKTTVELYQDKRIYLDEYKGQENRLDIYKENKLKQDTVMAKICGSPYEPSVPYTISIEKLIDCFKMINISLISSEHMSKTTVYDDTLTITYNPNWDVEEPDNYFYNRWLRRN